MARAKANPQAIRLAARLAELSQPLYVVTPQGEIEFVNQALADWAGVREDELVGRNCRYHSEPAQAAADQIAAALCPPPAAFRGVPVETSLRLALSESRLLIARVKFVPLGLPTAEESCAILATLELNPPASAPAPASSESVELHAQLQAWRSQLFSKSHPARLCGTSAAIRRACEQIQVAIEGQANVLIVAPQGARAHLFARQIHAGRSNASRAVPIDGQRFDAEDIRELPIPGSAASEHRSSPNVTLLCLDVDRLSAEAQLELESRLREAATGVRTISTATRSVETLAAEQQFRHELAYRLSTLTITIPPLAERIGDLPLLAQALVEELNAAGEKQLGGFTSGALDQLADHDWPGDVEELAAVIRQAFANSDGPHITASDLPPQFVAQLRSKTGEPKRVPGLDLESFLGELETELLERALALAKGNKTKAAKILGMTRPRLYRRLVQRGLEQPSESDTFDEIDWSEEPSDESSADSAKSDSAPS